MYGMYFFWKIQFNRAKSVESFYLCQNCFLDKIKTKTIKQLQHDKRVTSALDSIGGNDVDALEGFYKQHFFKQMPSIVPWVKLFARSGVSRLDVS